MAPTSNLTMLAASSYTQLDRTTDEHGIRRELERVINSQPTQIYPDERESYLRAILDDLRVSPDGTWTRWSDELYLLALTALKTLSRNPIGTTTLYDPHYLPTLLHHTGLVTSPSTSTSTFASDSNSTPNIARSFAALSTRHASTSTASSLEASRVLANALVLHPQAREGFAKLQGGVMIARALRGQTGQVGDGGMTEEIEVERLFLLGRLGFLVTIDRATTIREMVDEEELVGSLSKILSHTPTIPQNFAALSELLKLVNNVVRYYPSSEEWADKLEPLLAPVLNIFHQLPFDELLPPLTHAIHVLLSIPFLPHLLPTWYSGAKPLDEPATSTSPSGEVPSNPNSRSAMNKITSLLASARTSLDPHPTIHPDPTSSRSRTPSPPSSSATLPQQPSALPARLLKTLSRFLDTYLPYPKNPDDGFPDGIAVDEILPPVLLLLARAATGSEPMRRYLRLELFPIDLDRSPSAGTLESRPGLTGNLLRLLNGAVHIQCRDTAGELLWAVCDSDPSTLSTEIGYGNAAGLLFRKGLAGPPQATISEIDDSAEPPPSTSSRESHPPLSTASKPTPTASCRHPITALELDPSSDKPSPLDGLTQEEKEREAEKLFVLFDRIERNPVLSMTSGAGAGAGAGSSTSPGSGKDGNTRGLGNGATGMEGERTSPRSGAGVGAEAEAKFSMKEMMRAKLETGEMAEWEKRDEESEQRRLEEEEKREEEEVAREMRAYRERMGRK